MINNIQKSKRVELGWSHLNISHTDFFNDSLSWIREKLWQGAFHYMFSVQWEPCLMFSPWPRWLSAHRRPGRQRSSFGLRRGDHGLQDPSSWILEGLGPSIISSHFMMFTKKTWVSCRYPALRGMFCQEPTQPPWTACSSRRLMLTSLVFICVYHQKGSS